MNEIQTQVLLIQCQIKGFYQVLKELGQIPCPECGKAVIYGGTTYTPDAGYIAIPRQGAAWVELRRCETCKATGRMAGMLDDELLNLNRLVRWCGHE